MLFGLFKKQDVPAMAPMIGGEDNDVITAAIAQVLSQMVNTGSAVGAFDHVNADLMEIRSLQSGMQAAIGKKSRFTAVMDTDAATILFPGVPAHRIALVAGPPGILAVLDKSVEFTPRATDDQGHVTKAGTSLLQETPNGPVELRFEVSEEMVEPRLDGERIRGSELRILRTHNPAVL